MVKSTTTLIGKDVIESLTLSMYDDSRFIYREYIQNAADQIDKASAEGLIGSGEIHIQIDQAKRKISIEDNATGIAEDSVASILKNVAQSTKRRGIDKGFRGIGRLGGLGYCSKLVFETSYAGEATKSIMTWDATQLRKILNDRGEKEQAAAVIDAITELKVEKEKPEQHYFKVHLIDVNNDELLNVSEVRRYLSMVAPVPFDIKFHFRKKIYDEMAKEGISNDEYNIFINEEQLYKGYSSYIYEGDQNNQKILGEVIDVHFFKECDAEQKPLYWGWYGITKKNQSLAQVNFARGFRLRKANIQIGDESTLTRFHRDRRFQFYFIGEVLGLSGDLIPNARRDFFSENETCLLFENKLKNFFYTTIHKLCYTASDINSSVKKIEDFANAQKEYKEKAAKGFSHPDEHNELREKLERKKDAAAFAQVKLSKIEQTAKEQNSAPIASILDKVEHKKLPEFDTVTLPKPIAKPKLRTDALTKLNSSQRKLLNEVFAVIQNVLQVDMADNLIKKIEEKLK